MFEYICLFNRHTTPIMLDSFDTSMPVEAASAVSFDELSSKYDALLSFYSVRTNNVLHALEGDYPDRHAFLDAFVKMSRRDIRSLKNCGAKTVDEILAIQSILNPTHEGQNTDAPDFIPRSLPAVF